MSRTENTYIYGHHPVSELLRGAPRDVEQVYVASAARSTRLADVVSLAKRHHIPIVDVSGGALEDLVGDAVHQGVVARVRAFQYAPLDVLLKAAERRKEPPLLLALDQVQDPQNLGALVRSALALGAHGIVLPKNRSCTVTPTVVKASAGATAHLPIARVTNLRRALDELKEVGLWVFGAVPEGGQALDQTDLRQATVIVLGSEGDGMRRLVTEGCDLLVEIPMAGRLGSINVSAAGAILLYEVQRQRRAG
jgi:23S rRNA (guanosine2251-2'-O)-methyltransferase